MKAFLHTTDNVTDRVIDILGKAKELSGVEETIDFAPLAEDYIPPRGAPVLSLGTYKRRGLERVVQTYSIKQIMVKGDAISRLVGAFKLLTSVPELPEMKYEVVDSLIRLQEVEELIVGKCLAVDIETKGSVDEQIPDWDYIISLAVYDGDTAYVFDEHLVQHPIARDMHLHRILSESYTIAHNGKFDFKYLSYPTENLYPDDDTQLMHYALHPAASDHGLKPLALEYFGAEDWDSANKQYLGKEKAVTKKQYREDGAYVEPGVNYTSKNGYERIPRTMLYEYNAYDVYWTYWLWRVFKAGLEAMEVHPYEHLMKLSHMFQRIETFGVRFDIPYMQDMQAQLNEKGTTLEAQLHETVGFPLNPRSPKQLKEYFTSAGYKVKSTDAEALAKLSSEGSEVADLITQLRDVNKKNGTYITGFLDKLVGERGYPTFKLHASITGRIGGGGTSLLTIPREKAIKKMVLPDEGHVMVGADLSQAELRVMALESQDPWLIKAFQPDAGDFFDILLSEAYPEEDWTALHEEGGNWYNNKRASMKGVVYGVSFARGTKAISMALGIPMDEAQKLVDGFVRPGSEFDQWREEIKATVLRGEPLYNRFGRRFQAELITHRNKDNVLRSALSFTSQSTANDLLLQAASRVEPELVKWDARMISTLHDAIYASTPEREAEIVGEYIVKEMRQAGIDTYGTQVLFEADWGIGNSLAEV